MGETKLDGYLCERCEHTWIARAKTIQKPKVCPKCKSPYWNTARKNQIPQAIKEKQYGLFPESI